LELRNGCHYSQFCILNSLFRKHPANSNKTCGFWREIFKGTA